MWEEWQLAHPWAIWALIGLPMVAFLLLYARARKRAAACRFLGEKQGKRALPNKRFVLSIFCFTTVWLFAVLAWMGPERRLEIHSPQPNWDTVQVDQEALQDLAEKGEVRRPLHDVILLMDASASMEVSDTRTGVARLEFAREVADELIRRLDGENVALYAFTSQLTPLLPPTLDYLYSRLLLRKIAINEGDVAGTDFAEALDGIARKHFNKLQKRARTVVIFTDGGDTLLESSEGEERRLHLEALLGRVDNAEELGLQLFCVGLGSKQGREIPGVVYNGQPVVATLDEEFLQKLAERGNGEYFFGNDHSALSLADAIKSRMRAAEEEVLEQNLPTLPNGQMPVTAESHKEWEEHSYFRWPLGFAILLLMIELLCPWIVKSTTLS